MKWDTAISSHTKGELHVRGIALSSLMEHKTFSEVIFLLLCERLPTVPQTKLLNVVLVACAEHGVEVPSAYVARVSISSGNSLTTAIAAGLLAIGTRHGGAIEAAAHLIQSDESPEEIIKKTLASGERMPGFGHKLYKDKDPRAEMILETAMKLGMHTYVGRARELGAELKRQTGTHLPINIDGAVAAAISELGADWRLGNAFFALGRMPGIIAHAYEEMKTEKTYRRIDESDVTYTGPHR